MQATAATPQAYGVAGVAAPPDADGLASQSALFFSAAEAGDWPGTRAEVDAIGVLAEPGVDVGALHERVAAALQGTAARVHAGEDSGLVGSWTRPRRASCSSPWPGRSAGPR